MSPAFSSNWQKLQSTIKSQTEKKRKEPPTQRQLNTIAKRKRLEAKSILGAITPSASAVINRNKMGMSQSILKDSEPKDAPSATLALWAEDNGISTEDLKEAYGENMKAAITKGAAADKINEGLCQGVEIGQYVAMDCEMVGVGGSDDRSVLARVSIVNYHGSQIYDSFVRPKEFVTDWRTHVSGVSAKNMTTARTFEEVHAEVAEILKDRVLVGHAIKNDLDVLMIGHPKKDIRDTSRFSGFRKYASGRTPSLKKLAKEVLGVEIQGGQHSSIEDARATMLLLRRNKQAFDLEHQKRFPSTRAGSGQKSKNGKNSSRGKR